MAKNYLSEIANMGFGGGGTSGYYSNMNSRLPGVGSVLQQGQKAGNLKYINNAANQFAKGNIKEGVKSGIGYALNQNPYIAGLNTFNQLTGGIRFDKMLGMGPKKPKVTSAQQKEELDYEQMMVDDRNRYLSGAGKAADSAQRYEEFLNNERNSIRDLEQNGPSARSLAPMLGQFAARNYASEGAARSSTAANLSRRGISPNSGLALGAEAAVDTGLAATRGQQSSAVMNQVMDMLQQRRGAMLGIDAAGRKSAMDREESMLDASSSLGLKGRELGMTQQRIDDLRSQQQFDRRQAEQSSLGKLAGQFGPAALREIARLKNNNNSDNPGQSIQIADELKRDFARQDVKPYDDRPDVFNPSNNFSFDNFGVQPSTNRFPVADAIPERMYTGPANNLDTFEDFAGVSQNRGVPSLAPESAAPQNYNKRPNPAMGSIDFSRAQRLNGDDIQARSDVFNEQNPYAMEGQIIEFQGQFYRKTYSGWEPIS